MSAQFSGSNSFTQSDAVWAPGTGGFTVAHFIKVANGYATGAIIIGNRPNTPWWRSDINQGVTNGINMDFNDTLPRWNNANTVNDGSWHSFVITTDSSGNIIGYKDGSAVGSTVTNTTNLTGSSPLIIGSQESLGSPLTGLLARVVVDVGHAWTSGQVSAYNSTGIPPSSTGLWNFQTSGSLTTDSSGNSHTLTNNASVTYNSDEPIPFPSNNGDFFLVM